MASLLHKPPSIPESDNKITLREATHNNKTIQIQFNLSKLITQKSWCHD